MKKLLLFACLFSFVAQLPLQAMRQQKRLRRSVKGRNRGHKNFKGREKAIQLRKQSRRVRRADERSQKDAQYYRENDRKRKVIKRRQRKALRAESDVGPIPVLVLDELEGKVDLDSLERGEGSKNRESSCLNNKYLAYALCCLILGVATVAVGGSVGGLYLGKALASRSEQLTIQSSPHLTSRDCAIVETMCLFNATGDANPDYVRSNEAQVKKRVAGCERSARTCKKIGELLENVVENDDGSFSLSPSYQDPDDVEFGGDQDDGITVFAHDTEEDLIGAKCAVSDSECRGDCAVIESGDKCIRACMSERGECLTVSPTGDSSGDRYPSCYCELRTTKGECIQWVCFD